MLDAIYNAMSELSRGNIKPEHVVIKLPEQEYYALANELQSQFSSDITSVIDLAGYIDTINTPFGKVIIENTGRAMPNGQTR